MSARKNKAFRRLQKDFKIVNESGLVDLVYHDLCKVAGLDPKMFNELVFLESQVLALETLSDMLDK